MGKSDRANCANCNKSLRRVDQYYRDGKYWCGKKCYKKFKEKESQESE